MQYIIETQIFQKMYRFTGFYQVDMKYVSWLNNDSGNSQLIVMYKKHTPTKSKCSEQLNQ